MSAGFQASGEAKYSSDMPSSLHGAYVLSTSGLKTLVSLDASKALAMPGVVALIGAKDVPGSNTAVTGTDKVFYDVGDVMPYIGAPIALVVADTAKRARAAAKACVLTFVEDASSRAHRQSAREAPAADLVILKAKHVKGPFRHRIPVLPSPDGVTISRGNTKEALASAASTVQGTVGLGGQKHFFLETHAAHSAPDEGQRLRITCGTQYPQYTQQKLAAVLGVPLNKVEVKVRNVGGAYGGKITHNVWSSAACAVAAWTLGKPVAIHNERVDDMTMLGGREQFVASYTAGLDDAGNLTALDLFFSVDGGNTLDDSSGSLFMAVIFFFFSQQVHRYLQHLFWSAGPVE
jgi:xanthine dehydrogenase molybdopterin-binding subunit B